MASAPFTALTVDCASFDGSKRIVGWSSTPAAIYVGTATGFSVLDSAFPALRSISAVSVSPSQTVAVLGIPASASPTESSLYVSFVSAGMLVHTSPRPLPSYTTSMSPLFKSCRLGQLDLCFVSAVGTRSVSLYQRQRPEVLEAVALDDDIVLMEDGPFHGSVVCVLSNGKVVVISVEESGSSNTAVRLVAVAEVDTTIRGIRAAKCAGKSLLWLLTSDGRLFGYQARPNASSGGDEESSPRRRSVSVARGELFSLVQATFYDASQGVRLSGFTVPGNAILWADETSKSVSLAVISDEEGYVELTKVTVDPALTSFVTSVAMELEAKTLVSICAQPHQWDLLTIHPRKNVMEHVALEVGPVLAANAPMTNVGAGGDTSIKALCSSVAWAPHEQLGLLRQRCEVILDSLEKRTSTIASAEVSKSCTETLVALQHAALAFLKREHEDTDCIDPQNSVSHYLLRRLRDVYTRIAAHDLLIAAGIPTQACKLGLDGVMSLANRRETLAASRDTLRSSFYESFRMTATQEHPVAAIERWGHPHQRSTLSIDVVAREFSIDLDAATINELIAQYPHVTSGTNDPSTAFSIALLYAVQCLSSVPHAELTHHVVEFLRTIDIPSGIWPWVTLLFHADHVDVDDASSSPLLDCSCLDSSMPLVPQLLPSIVDGLIGRGRLEDALKLSRFALSVYPPQQIPHGLGSKLLLLAFRGGDAALVTHIASRARGTALSALAVRAVALVSETLESLSMADGLYETSSSEFRMLEEAFTEQAAQEPSDSFINTTLLCELRLGGAKRYEETDTDAAKIANKMPVNHAQQFYAFREHLRAHLTSAPSQGAHLAGQQAQHSGPSTSNTTKRSTTCLREVDESLDDAVRCTSSSSIAVHRASSQQCHRRGASLKFVGLEGGLFPPTSMHRMTGVTAQEESDQLCDRVTGDLGKTCKKPRPCPFHDAAGR